MSKLDPSLRTLLLWGVPIAVLAILLGVELGWGRSVHRAPPPDTPKAPAPVSVGLLPDYAIAGGAESLAATSEHTLFNPTRQPAPPAPVTASGDAPRMQHGQFVLTGTAMYETGAVAYLKEAQGGKTRVVKQGEKINGMVVAEVTNSGIRFTLGGESEELSLKVAAGPKTTVQPTAARPATAGGRPAGVPARNGVQPQANPAEPAQPMTLGERRRAARAADAARKRAEAEAKGGAPADGTNGSNDAPPAAQSSSARAAIARDPRWGQLFQQYRSRNAAPQ